VCWPTALPKTSPPVCHGSRRFASSHGLLRTSSRGRPPTSARLGARYVLDGSVRRAGSTVRVSVRLVDAETGSHLWAENYDRDLGEGTFALQDDIASRVVATVADDSGVLVRSMAVTLKDRPIEELSVTELALM